MLKFLVLFSLLLLPFLGKSQATSGKFPQLYAYYEQLVKINTTDHQLEGMGASVNYYSLVDSGVYTIDRANDILYLLVTNAGDIKMYLQGVNITDGSYLPNPQFIDTYQPFDLQWNSHNGNIYIVADYVNSGLLLTEYDPTTKQVVRKYTATEVFKGDNPWFSAIVNNTYYISGVTDSATYGGLILYGVDLDTGVLAQITPINNYEFSGCFVYNDSTIYAMGQSPHIVDGHYVKALYQVDLPTGNVVYIGDIGVYTMVYQVGLAYDGVETVYSLLKSRLPGTSSYYTKDFQLVSFNITDGSVIDEFDLCNTYCPWDIFCN